MWTPWTPLWSIWSPYGAHVESMWSPHTDLAGLSAKKITCGVHLDSMTPPGLHWIPAGIGGAV